MQLGPIGPTVPKPATTLIASRPMRRVLRGFEAAATRSHDHAPFVVVLAAELEHGPSPEQLGAALLALQAQQPLLRVRIAESGGGYRFESGVEVPRLPLVVRERGARDDLWLEVAEEELNQRLDDRTGPLLRCTYLTPSAPSARAEILLTLHHAIVDAASGLHLMDQLLRHLAGEELDPSTRDVPTLQELLPRRFAGGRGLLRKLGFLLRQAADEASYRLLEPGPRKLAASSTRCHPLVAQLARDETSALVRATRRRRVTLKSAIDAAFLLAVLRRLPDVHRGRSRARLRYMTFAGLRQYLEPPLSVETLGGFIAMLRHTIAVHQDEDFWDLARRITGQVEKALRRGDKITSALLAETMIRLALRQSKHRMATVAVSYSGPARPRSQYGATRLRDLHGFVSNFGIGPRYTALSRLLEGALTLDVVYLDADMDRELAQTLADDVIAILRSAASSETPTQR